MGMFSAINTSASGLTAQRLRMDIISENIANANTTRTKTGGPYRRKMVVFEAGNNSFASVLNRESNSLANNEASGGVKATKIVEDSSEFTKKYDPSNPDADKDGYVSMPNVNIVNEMVDMISATRSYEANVTSLNATKGMALKALEIGS